ncbi:hypothetical protein T492DRAFT_850673 [Pavlovales sp. CCMP2436]|nr:hypothetical protein T492DRAFT_850673 [Pavlovales sp. CCMP2436]
MYNTYLTIKPKREPNLSGVAWSASADEGKGKWLAFSVETEQQLPGGLAHNAEKDGENLNFAAPLLVIGHFDSRAEAAAALAYNPFFMNKLNSRAEALAYKDSTLLQKKSDSRAEAAEALAYSLQLLGQQGQTVEQGQFVEQLENNHISYYFNIIKQMVSGPDPLMPPLPPRGMGRAKKGRGEGTEVVVRTKINKDQHNDKRSSDKCKKTKKKIG